MSRQYSWTSQSEYSDNDVDSDDEPEPDLPEIKFPIKFNQDDLDIDIEEVEWSVEVTAPDQEIVNGRARVRGDAVNIRFQPTNIGLHAVQILADGQEFCPELYFDVDGDGSYRRLRQPPGGVRATRGRTRAPKKRRDRPTREAEYSDEEDFEERRVRRPLQRNARSNSSLRGDRRLVRQRASSASLDRGRRYSSTERTSDFERRSSTRGSRSDSRASRSFSTASEPESYLQESPRRLARQSSYGNDGRRPGLPRQQSSDRLSRRGASRSPERTRSASVGRRGSRRRKMSAVALGAVPAHVSPVPPPPDPGFSAKRRPPSPERIVHKPASPSAADGPVGEILSSPGGELFLLAHGEAKPVVPIGTAPTGEQLVRTATGEVFLARDGKALPMQRGVNEAAASTVKGEGKAEQPR